MLREEFTPDPNGVTPLEIAHRAPLASEDASVVSLPPLVEGPAVVLLASD